MEASQAGAPFQQNNAPDRDILKPGKMNPILYKAVEPAARLMDRLKFKTKLSVMAGIFLLALAGMIVILIPELDQQITFANKEREGIAPLHTSRDLLSALQLHRGLQAQKLRGNNAVDARLSEARAQVDARLVELRAQSKAQSEDLAKVEALLEEDWAKLKASTETDARKSFVQHEQLIARLLLFNEEMANATNLMLDPELDSFAVMDLTVMKIPATMEALAALRGRGALGLRDGSLTPEDRVQLKAMHITYDKLEERMHSTIQSLFKNRPDIKQRLAALESETDKAAEALMEALDNKLLASEQATISSDEFFALGTRAVDAQVALHKAFVPELDMLLKERIARYKAKEYYTLGGVGLGLLVVAYLFMGFVRSLTASMRGLARAAREIAHGKFPDPIILQTKDELQEIADEILLITRTLQRFENEQRDLAAAHERGEIGKRMPETAFEGAYRDMADAVNLLAEGHLRVQQKMADVVKAYSRGDFSVDMDRLPGELAAISAAMDGVKSNLQAVNQEIMRLGDAAARASLASVATKSASNMASATW
ncbi:MAG: HAMP domain-containing protein [Burkholderiales bacterium]|nr:HAMP domain-containing protein [Burkholderiales bacterium]